MALKSIISATVAAVVFATSAQSQSTHDQMAMHGNAAMPATLTEPGQGAFAAISEIVALLRSDPKTDWSSVNITGLRQHLVDMDNLITNSKVGTSEIDGGIEMRISLTGIGGDAAKRMVTAHGPVLAAETGWSSIQSQTADTMIWRVTDNAAASAIRSLGFYGLMAVGDHHRDHHLSLAKGETVH